MKNLLATSGGAASVDEHNEVLARRYAPRWGMDAWWVPPRCGLSAAWLGADALGGLTLVAVALPSQMATARLADLPAVAGLYAFIAGSLLYAVLGSNRHLSVGADSSIAPVLATGVAAVADGGYNPVRHHYGPRCCRGGCTARRDRTSSSGWIAEFLSTPVITGVLAGIAVEIVVRQVPIVLGLPGGGTTTIGRIRLVSDQIGHTNGWTVAIAIGVLVLIVAAQLVDRRIPGALLV